jgi:uncharacterized small protein (DUF1192 family)
MSAKARNVMVGASQADESVEELEAKIRQLEDELSALKLKRLKKDQGNARATRRSPSKSRKDTLNTRKRGAIVLLFYGALFSSIVYWNYYSEKHSTRSVVIAKVDDWRLYSGGGGIGSYSIKITLPDGSKGSASAHPAGLEPPKPGQEIRLVKIISGFGFTSYVWERPVLSFSDAVRDGVPSTYITRR